MIGTATAFAPGHITGFFEICDEETDPAKIGSRGAGFSVKLGVTSRIEIKEDGFPGILCLVNGEQQEASTTRSAVELLLGREALNVTVHQTMELPVSQGFGMSAAGALSASLATASILGRTRRDAVWAAHCAEVMNRTGLGDVVGSAVGGFETRLEPGCEPHGKIEPFRAGEPVDDVMVAVVDQEILTKRILTDPNHRRDIKAAGASALKKFREAPGLRSFADVSKEFSIETHLASDRISRIYREVERLSLVGQCMLGGSVFAFGRSHDVKTRLSRWGRVVSTKVEFNGARVVEPAPAPRA